MNMMIGEGILLFIMSLFIGCSHSGLRHVPSQEVLHTLKNEQVRIIDGKRYFGDAWLETRGNLYMIHLKGSPYEIGFQHGVLMSEEIRKGPIKIYADPITGGRGGFSLKNWVLGLYLDWKVYRPLEKAQPQELLDEIKGIADGSGLPYEIIFKANCLNVVETTMTPILIKSSAKELEKLGITLQACSTFVATREATLNGKTIVGRNTDYPGVEGWPKYQTVFFVEPKEGYKYVKIGTAGILMWAPGMNEKGIVLCAHFMLYDDATPHGWDIPSFIGEILRKADSTESAVGILRNHPRGGTCGFVITDGKAKKAVAAEVSAGSVAVRGMENWTLAMTNMALSEEKRKIDFIVKYRLNEGTPARYRRLMQLIKEHYGEIDPSLAAEFMGDHIRITTGTERTTYGVLSVSDTVNSMVFSPEDLKFWVASGSAPMANNPYVGLDFSQEIKGIKSQVIPEVLEGYQFKNPNKRLAMEKYHQAHVIYERNPDRVDDILMFLREASMLDPEEAVFNRLIATILLHQGQYDEAISIIEKILSVKQSLNEMAQDYLILGMLYDLKRDRQKALSYYQKIDKLLQEEPNDPWFKINAVLWGFAQKYKKEPFTRKQFSDRSVFISFTQEAGIE